MDQLFVVYPGGPVLYAGAKGVAELRRAVKVAMVKDRKAVGQATRGIRHQDRLSSAPSRENGLRLRSTGKNQSALDTGPPTDIVTGNPAPFNPLASPLAPCVHS